MTSLPASLQGSSSLFLIGKGPSLTDFDYERLRGQATVAINDACLRVPFASAVFSADYPWIQRFQRDQRKVSGELCLVVAEDKPRHLPAHYFHRVRSLGFSDSEDTLNIYGCSGYAALNLAYLLGAPKVYLLGYDLNSPSMYRLWATYFDSTVDQLKAKGIEVINLNPTSQITSFPRMSYHELDLFRRS